MFKCHKMLLAAVVLLSACTAHPRGESTERKAAALAGEPYVHPIEQRQVKVLSAEAGPEELVVYALLANGDVERSYWEWRAAIEQIPQDGTQKTDVSISFESMITNGRTALDMNMLGIGNDPMAGILLPGKLAKSAAVALEDARAAGVRFDKTRFELRARVLSAYADYALTAEEIRLQNGNVELLGLIKKVTESRVATGTARQQELLKAANETDIANNELAAMSARLPGELAAINALLNRAPDAALTLPAAIPEGATLPENDEKLLADAAEHNPELRAQLHDIAARRIAIERARLDFIPDFSVNATTDLAGMTQSLLGSVTLPLLRYEAIDASVQQAKARLRAAQAARRQAASDLGSEIVEELATIRDSQRQVEVYEKTILPRAQEIVAAVERSYSGGNAGILEMLDAQRSLIVIRQMIAELKTQRVKSTARLEALLGARVGA